MDTYLNFTELKQHESEYSIELRNRCSEVTIIAPHGGRIEPHTCEIARLIAADDYNYFCFNGQKPGNNHDLHITSHNYDEDQAVALVQRARVVIGVHGCSLLEPIIYLGGLDLELIEMISATFADHHIPYSRSGEKYGGLRTDNICNRGIRGKGVQLEISRPLRDDSLARETIAVSIRSVLSAQ